MSISTCKHCGKDFVGPTARTLYCENHRRIPSFNPVAATAKRRAIEYGLTEHYTGGELFELVQRYGGACMRCGKTKAGFMGHVADHIVSLSLGGSNTIDNIQILCFSCNGSKRNSTINYRQFVSL